MKKAELTREIGTYGAVMLGLGSIIGTGAFVAIGIAAGIAGSFLIISIIVAAALALCNALSSAQLAADHPVSGGTYEYGRKYLSPLFGFKAGWVFICAKSASAATAALGFSGYFLNFLNLNSNGFLIFSALLIVVVLTFLVLFGIRRTNRVNSFIVSVTLSSLLIFIVFGLTFILGDSHYNFEMIVKVKDRGISTDSVLYGSALMFVAFTGYGRIATLGEEVKEPAKTIPKSIVITLIISTVIYLLIGTIGLNILGPEKFSFASESEIAPLEFISRSFGSKWVFSVVSVGAMTAMIGVLLNLILGVSRVLFAMGRNMDLPVIFSGIRNSSPIYAVILSGLIICVLVMIGDVKTTWSLSAFTVLIYYSITNLSALRLPKQSSMFPKWVSVIGLVGCLSISIYVEFGIVLKGLVIILAGVFWYFLASSIRGEKIN